MPHPDSLFLGPLRSFLASLLAVLGTAAVSWAADSQTLCNEQLYISYEVLSPLPRVTSSHNPGDNLGTFKIIINPGPTLAAHPDALAAFNRAAAVWEARISDPVTIHINADLGTLADGTLGQTTTSRYFYSYSSVRTALMSDADADDALLAAFPASPTFILPPDRTFMNQLGVSKANLKALGFDVSSLDAQNGTQDGTIVFNTNYSFDYDNSNGVGSGLTDFESVAAHEIGHLLGFNSSVDNINTGTTAVRPTVMDMFRFSAGNFPLTAAQFTSFSRTLIPGQEVVWNDTVSQFLLSTGRNTGLFAGTDGRQTSHWKDDSLTGIHIGIMDPTLSTRQAFPVADTDLRALDLVGYDIVFTEPLVTISGSVTLQGLASGAAARPVTFEFRPEDGGEPLTFVQPIGVGAALQTFSFTVPPGVYELAVKGTQYLRQVVTVNAGASSEVTVPGLTLLGGDVNNDNRVNLTDLVQLRGNYGKTAAGLTGDLTGDGKVNLTDLVLLRGNYGKQGQQ